MSTALITHVGIREVCAVMSVLGAVEWGLLLLTGVICGAGVGLKITTK